MDRGVLAEREALIAEALAAGPKTATGLAREIYALAGSQRVPRSLTARVTQSLRVMEREGIVKRGLGAHGRRDWQLAR